MADRSRLHSEVYFGDDVTVDDISFTNPKKRILFEEDVSKSDVDYSEHMKCYLRIRPFSEEELASNEDQSCLSIEDDTTVATHAPKESNTFKNCTHGLGKTTHKFKFSRIFNASTTQKDFFNDTMLGLVKDFIDGQNCLVFTYGVTSSGKTYTIQGKPKDAGILPRALDVLFNSINGKQWPNNNLKPKMFMDVTRLSPEQSAEETRIKERTLKMVTFDEPDVMSLLGDDASDMSQVTNSTTCSEGSNASYSGRVSKDSLDEVFSDIENRVREEAAVSVEDQGLIKFSVWVSFAEIYNEQIFDLLEPIPKKKTTRRQVLRLSDDKNGSPYIKGLKEIHVTSADEAYNLLTVGQKNLRMACTKLNHQSSRSHCIFNIKILRVVDKGNPNHARVSMLSLCDLAGSERQSKTQSKGDRLKEAGNINTSLLTLGRCIEILRNNQHHKDKTQLIPFRDSKLTRLFQNFFCGRGKAAMIVNVNQCASMFDETLHVFKFSAVAKQVVVVQKPDPPLKKRLKSVPLPKQVPRPSIPWATPGAADISHLNSALKRGQAIPLPEDDEDDMDEDSMDDSEVAQLVRIIETLRQKLKEEKRSKLIMEHEVRQEVCKEMMEQIVKIENEYEEQLREREILAEEMMEKRIKIITDSMTTNPRKRPRQDVMEDDDDEWVSSVLLHQEKVKVQEKEEELELLKDDLETTKAQLNKYITEQEEYIAKNTSLQFKLSHLEKQLAQKAERKESEVDLGESCLLETLTQQLQDAKDQIKKQEAEIKELNAMLTEAGETFQQKEKEISQLKDVINCDEKKLKQQELMVTELQNALEESKQAIDNAEERLVRKDERIVKLESETQEFEAKLKNQKNCNGFLEETLKQKNEEIMGWKNKFDREEAESFKREQALINGYKAEISNLKTQLHQLKTEAKVMCSPVKLSPSIRQRDVESPCKRARMDSPARHTTEVESLKQNRINSPSRNKKNDLSCLGDSNQHFKEDLSRQIKDLQTEFTKNLLVTSELESALQIARLTSEDLESRLKSEEKARRKAEVRAEALTAQLKETEDLKIKLEIETKGKQNLDLELEKLRTELNNLQDIQVSQKDLQSNYDDMEKHLASKVEENLTAESNITSLEAELASLRREGEQYRDKLSSLEDKVSQLLNEIQEVTNVNKEVRELNSQLESKVKELNNQLESKVQECNTTITEKRDNLKLLEEFVSKLQKELAQKEMENASLSEKMEEMETVNASLREMVNQTTNQIQEKETEIKEIIVENLQNCDSPSTDSLSNIRKKMRELKQECEKHKQKSIDKSKDVDTLKQQIKLLNDARMKAENDLKKANENCKDIEFQLEEKTVEITGVMEEKVALEAKVDELQSRITQLEGVSKEKSKQVLELNDEMNKIKVAKEMLEADLQDLEEGHDELQKTIVDLKAESHSRESDLREMEEKIASLQQVRDEQEINIITLKEKITNFESGKMSKEEILQQTAETLKREISEKEANFLEMEKHLGNEKSDYENQISLLRKELDAKSNKLDDCSRQLQEVTVEMEQKTMILNQLKDECSELKEHRSILESQIKELTEIKGKDEETLLDENKVLKTKIEMLNKAAKNECNEWKVKWDDLKNLKEKDEQILLDENKALKTKIELLNKDKVAVETECNEFRVKCEDLKTVTSDLQKQIELNDQEKKTLHKLIEESKQEKDHLQLMVNELKSDCTELKKTYVELQKKNELKDSEHDALSQAKLSIAELKSSLHMHKTLHDKVKTELIEREQTIARLEKALEEQKHGVSEFDDLKLKFEKCLEEKKELQCTCDDLNSVLNKKNAELDKLQENLNQENLKQENVNHENQKQENMNEEKVEQLRKDVNKMSRACMQQEMLIREQNFKIKNLESCNSDKQDLLKEIECLKTKCEQLENINSEKTMETAGYTAKLKISEQEIKNLNEAISQQQRIICEQSEKVKELMKSEGTNNLRLELEKLKSDLHNKTLELEGHQVKLCQVENDLVRINTELSSKEQVIHNLKENLEQFKESDCLSPTSQGHCARKLRKEKIEIENQLIEARFKIKQLEGDRHGGVISSPRRTVEQLQRAGVTSPTVHRELNRSQEREQTLRSQLQQASQTMKQQNDKISDMEKKLLETSTKLREAEDSLRQRQSFYGPVKGVQDPDEIAKLREEHAERFRIIQNLTNELEKSSLKIQTKKQAVADLKKTMEMERDKFETALRDANANEAVIEELKNAISLQEETMEQQDRYIQQKEETINKLQQEVEKYTDKYHQLLTTSGDSGREIREMTRENVRLSAEIEQLKKTIDEMKIKLEQIRKSEDDLKRTNQKLSDDKLMLSSVIKENNEEMKEMERLLSERRKECEELKTQNNTEKLEAIDLKCKEQEGLIAEMKNKLKEKDHSLRDSHKEIRQISEELEKLRNEVKEKDNGKSENQKQMQHKNEEIIKLQRTVEDKTNELNNWKLERDKLVQGLEGIMKKQQKEINDLKKQKTELEQRLSHPTSERGRHVSGTHHEKVIHVHDSVEEVFIKQEAPDVFKSPPRQSSIRRGRKRRSPKSETTDPDTQSSKKEVTDDNITFVSEDGDTSHHIEIDVTPAIAAKTLRKSRKKRSSVDLLREEKNDKENKKSKTERKTRSTKTSETPDTSGRGISRIGSIMSAIKESPITRSAKKFLEEITEVTSPNKDGDSTVEIEDHGTQMSPAVNKRGTSRKKHALYKDSIQISEPLDCGSFVTVNEDDVHTTVQRKLRGRRK